MLERKFEKLFDVQPIEVSIPAYAKIHESIICNACGESIMGTRILNKKGEELCYTCASAPFNSLDGNGIKCNTL